MTSLMSVFDPSSSLKLFNGWLILFLLIPLMSVWFWLIPSYLGMVEYMLFNMLSKMYSINKVIFTSLFMFFLVVNIIGLLPMMFSPTSHLSFNISLALILWLGMMIWFIMYDSKHLLSHLTPMGCPMLLVPLMVIIELVSSLIRPITLSLRLMANVMAGHMILILMSKGVYSMMPLSFPMFMILSFFLLFEVGVAIIQAFVFSSLMSLYWEESINE